MEFNKNESWELQEDDCFLHEDFDFDIAGSLWNDVSQEGGDISHMLGETTPVKACGDLALDVLSREKVMEQEVRGASQLKRRRVLQFNSPDTDISSAFLKSKEVEELVEEKSPGPSPWMSSLPDVSSGSDLVELDQSSNTWLAECFNDTEMQLSADDMSPSELSDIQIDITEFCNIESDSVPNIAQDQPCRTGRTTILRGKKYYMRSASANLASSIAYPFAFIKPCEFHGDVTLNDINQRIQTRPQLKQSGDTYPTSAFSGKPVVGRTKIRTEGGKGSITIMRTKG